MVPRSWNIDEGRNEFSILWQMCAMLEQIAAAAHEQQDAKGFESTFARCDLDQDFDNGCALLQIQSRHFPR